MVGRMSGRAVRVSVGGRVQGVGYREWTRRTADGLGVAGWVRNRLDGSVEAVLSGPDVAVDAMIERMRRGPRAAVVARVAVEEIEPVAGQGAFAVWPTA